MEKRSKNTLIIIIIIIVQGIKINVLFTAC